MAVELEKPIAYIGYKGQEENPNLRQVSTDMFRTQETAITNMIADLVLTERDKEKTEIVLLNGGQFRWTGDWIGAIKTKQFFQLLAI